MTKQLLSVIGLAAAILVLGRDLPDCHADSPLVFNRTTPTNDLKGSFAAQVLFAQSQILPSSPREGDNQPHLTSFRRSLLLVRPLKVNRSKPISVEVYDGQGRTLGRLKLDPPKLLPKTAYHVDGVPDGDVDFAPMKGTVGSIRRSEDLEKLKDREAKLLLEKLRSNAAVDIETADGRWVKDMYLPQDKRLNGKMIRVHSKAGYQSTIYYSGRQAALSKGKSLQFKCVNGQWLQAADLENNRLTYADDTWSTVLPAEWIEPGLKLRIRQGDQVGELSGMKVGAPTQLLIHTIDIGMLTTPRGEFAFAEDSEAHREYFQTIPVSRLIVAQYAPLELSEVMMPDGSRLTNADPSEGGWHIGNMRQRIGKELISHGIDNANYGIHSSAGEGETGHPFVAAQLAAHNCRGKYSNGIQVHGGSGGGGIVTLDNSLGNELSHEIGHNYGLGHYVDGFRGSVHRGADEFNSTWGWDADKNRFIPNFAPTRSQRDTCVEGQCQAPFDGRSYGLDAMAGGEPLSGLNRFTLYTPNTAVVIQRFMESKAVFDADSPTGFKKWNPNSSRMEPYTHRVRKVDGERKPRLFGVPVVTLVGYYDPDERLPSYIYPALHGAYGFCYPDDSATLRNSDCRLEVKMHEGTIRFRLDGDRLDGNVMNKFHVNVPEASRPEKVSIIIDGRVVTQKTIAVHNGKLTWTLNGRSTSDSERKSPSKKR